MIKKPMVFDVSPESLQGVTPGLEMAVTLSETFSVAVMRFTDRGALPNVSAKPHSHGEEVTIVLKGGATMQIAGADIPIDEGDIVVVPPGVEHSGFNRFPSSGECLRVNVVTPPRAEYVAAGGKPYYPTAAPSSSPEARAGGPRELRPSRFQRMTLSQAASGPSAERQIEGESVRVAVLKTIESASVSTQGPASRDDSREEVLFFLRGGCELEVAGTRLTVGPGQGVIVPADYQRNHGRITLRFDGGECVRVSVCERTQLQRPH